MNGTSPPPRFAEVLEYHLNLRLQKFAGRDQKLTRDLMGEMYEMINEVVHLVFSKSSRNPSNITKDWISQKYYENIKFSDSKIITEDPETWDHQSSQVYDPVPISKIPSADLRYIAGLFDEMVFAEEIAIELRKR